MDYIKIKNFERENGAGFFPVYRQIDPHEVDTLVQNLKNKLALPEDFPNRDIIAIISKKGSLVENANVEESPNTFRLAFGSLTINNLDKIYLNWDNFDVIDEMLLGDFLKYFDDVWYPGSDDLNIIDSKLRWIVTIHHAGMLEILDLGNKI